MLCLKNDKYDFNCFNLGGYFYAKNGTKIKLVLTTHNPGRGHLHGLLSPNFNLIFLSGCLANNHDVTSLWTYSHIFE